MPRARKRKQAETPEEGATPIAPVIETLARKYDLPTADMLPDPKLPDLVEKPSTEVRTVRPFVGRVASGRGVAVTADDTSYAIESDHPLTAGQLALATKQGFDDFSEDQDGRIMVADKAEMRRVGGDVNWVARSVTGPESGRGR